MENTLYYGDNLEILRKRIKDETVDLCYIDPPFNSKRNYNQIYNNIGSDDKAQAQAFTDTWFWDDRADKGYREIMANDDGRFTPQAVDLIKGLQPVLKNGGILAYLVHMTLRITEIHRVLKPTGSFYLHCDPTASHYLKLVLDAVFCSQGGEFLNEVIWSYGLGGSSYRLWSRKHDDILFYSRSDQWYFDKPQIAATSQMLKGKTKGMTDVWDIPTINNMAKERLGYPTQKPEALLERIIKASSTEDSVILDAYCGCGTTIAVAERLNRKWIGIDITYQSISLVLKRLEDTFGEGVLAHIKLDGIPRDMASATALSHRRDDRLRKEFEKWAILTYSNNRARINEKKGGDQGIDGTAFFLTSHSDNAKVVFQVKSGNVGRGDVSKLNNDRSREGAELAVFLTLQQPTRGMIEEARAAGMYEHPLMRRSYPRVQIVTIEEMIDQHKRLDVPMGLEVVKQARRVHQQSAEPRELEFG